jgi:hypothetical protein
VSRQRTNGEMGVLDGEAEYGETGVGETKDGEIEVGRH